jgi:MYXO-CTERM domain-containing protein
MSRVHYHAAIRNLDKFPDCEVLVCSIVETSVPRLVPSPDGGSPIVEGIEPGRHLRPRLDLVSNAAFNGTLYAASPGTYRKTDWNTYSVEMCDEGSVRLRGPIRGYSKNGLPDAEKKMLQGLWRAAFTVPVESVYLLPSWRHVSDATDVFEITTCDASQFVLRPAAVRYRHESGVEHELAYGSDGTRPSPRGCGYCSAGPMPQAGGAAAALVALVIGAIAGLRRM